MEHKLLVSLVIDFIAPKLTKELIYCVGDDDEVDGSELEDLLAIGSIGDYYKQCYLPEIVVNGSVVHSVAVDAAILSMSESEVEGFVVELAREVRKRMLNYIVGLITQHCND